MILNFLDISLHMIDLIYNHLKILLIVFHLFDLVLNLIIEFLSNMLYTFEFWDNINRTNKKTESWILILKLMLENANNFLIMVLQQAASSILPQVMILLALKGIKSLSQTMDGHILVIQIHFFCSFQIRTPTYFQQIVVNHFHFLSF